METGRRDSGLSVARSPAHDHRLSIHQLAGLGIPFSKPRFVLDAGELRTLNIPTIPPQKMYSMGSISQLPFLEYDLGYRQDQWEWNITDASYAKRWLFASFPRFASRSSHLSDDELIRLNAAILRTFVKLASEQGIVPVIAFFPDRPQIPA